MEANNEKAVCPDVQEEFDRLSKNGFGYFVFEDEKLVGVSIGFPDVDIESGDKVG